MITLAPDDNISSQMITFHPITWDAMLSSGANVSIWDEMLSSGMKFYHLGRNVIIWDEMLSSGMKCHQLG
jgi:hypothetical protein